MGNTRFALGTHAGLYSSAKYHAVLDADPRSTSTRDEMPGVCWLGVWHASFGLWGSRLDFMFSADLFLL